MGPIESSPQKARICQYFIRISPGSARNCVRKSDMPADKFWACSKLCPSKLRVFARRYHRKTPEEARKGRNLLVYNPQKDSSLAVDLWPSRTNACHLRSYCELFYGQEQVFILPTCLCSVISADMGRSIRGCWGQVTAFLLIIWGQSATKLLAICRNIC